MDCPGSGHHGIQIDAATVDSTWVAANAGTIALNRTDETIDADGALLDAAVISSADR